MENVQLKYYKIVKKEIESALKRGCLLNHRALRSQVRNLSARINVLKKGAEQDFTMTLEKLEKVNYRIAELSGYRQAYKEYLDLITK